MRYKLSFCFLVGFGKPLCETKFSILNFCSTVFYIIFLYVLVNVLPQNIFPILLLYSVNKNIYRITGFESIYLIYFNLLNFRHKFFKSNSPAILESALFIIEISKYLCSLTNTVIALIPILNPFQSSMFYTQSPWVYGAAIQN